MKAIIMMHGLPGTGKSFMAERIAESFSDAVILKTVSFRNIDDSSQARFDESLPKTREEKDATYKQIILAAKDALISGKMPVLDATFHKRYRREWVYELSREMNVKVAVISTVCDEAVVFERLKKRESDTNEDAFLKSRESFEIMKRQAEPLNEQGVLIKLVDTGKEIDFAELLKDVLS
jgi:predicted kinase